MCPRGACCRDSVSRRSCVSCVILVLCPRVSRLALHFLLCVFPSRCFSVPSLTCPLPSSLHLFLLPSLVSLSMCLPPCSPVMPPCLRSPPVPSPVSLCGMFLIICTLLVFALCFCPSACYFVFLSIVTRFCFSIVVSLVNRPTSRGLASNTAVQPLAFPP